MYFWCMTDDHDEISSLLIGMGISFYIVIYLGRAYNTVMKVSVIGACVKDEVLKIDIDMLLKGSTYIKDKITTYGGDALNEAIDLSTLGIDTKIISILGNDDTGDEILIYLNDHDIDTSNIKYRDIPTSKNTVLVDDNGQRYFITDPNGTLRKLTVEDVDVDRLEGIVAFASCFVSPLIDIAKMEELFKAIKDGDHILCIDFTKAKNAEKLDDIKTMVSYVDHLFINEEELKVLSDTDDYQRSAKMLLSYGAKNVIVKRGANGAYLVNGGIKIKIDAEKVDVVSTNGAGDGFVAGYIYGLACGHDLKTCLEYANRAGSIITSRLDNHLCKGDRL